MSFDSFRSVIPLVFLFNFFPGFAWFSEAVEELAGFVDFFAAAAEPEGAGVAGHVVGVDAVGAVAASGEEVTADGGEGAGAVKEVGGERDGAAGEDEGELKGGLGDGGVEGVEVGEEGVYFGLGRGGEGGGAGGDSVGEGEPAVGEEARAVCVGGGTSEASVC